MTTAVVDMAPTDVANYLKAHREFGALATLDLTEESRVALVGAYKGDTAAFLRTIFDCKVEAYEPQTWACDVMQRRFRDDSKVSIHYYGLGIGEKECILHEFNTDACSLLLPANNESREGGFGLIKDALAVLKQLVIVDLLFLNIEGYEYDLLRYIYTDRIAERFRYVLVQFHRTEKYSVDEIVGLMADYYHLRWDYKNWLLWEHR